MAKTTHKNPKAIGNLSSSDAGILDYPRGIKPFYFDMAAVDLLSELLTCVQKPKIDDSAEDTIQVTIEKDGICFTLGFDRSELEENKIFIRLIESSATQYNTKSSSSLDAKQFSQIIGLDLQENEDSISAETGQKFYEHKSHVDLVVYENCEAVESFFLIR